MAQKHAIRKILFDEGRFGEFYASKIFFERGKGVDFCDSKNYSGQADCQGGGGGKSVIPLLEGGGGSKIGKKRVS